MTTAPDAVVRRVQLLRTVGRLEEAESIARQAVAEHPQDAELLSVLASVLYEADRDAEALAAAEAAVSQEPSAEYAHRVRALSLAGLGRHSEALDAADAVIELCPHSSSSFVCRAAVLWKAGDYSGALIANREVISLAPDIVDGYLNLTQVYRRLGDASGANTAAQQALALEPDNSLALYMRAVLNVEAAEHDAALTGLADAGELEPRRGAQVLTGLAHVAWGTTISRWIVVVAAAVPTMITALIVRWGEWLTPSNAVRTVAIIMLLLGASLFSGLWRPLRGQTPLFEGLRSDRWLQISTGLLLIGIAIHIAVAVSGIGLLSFGIIPLVAVALGVAVAGYYALEPLTMGRPRRSQ
ncbi:MAG: hypothetical protein DLM55_02660 [Acidimicrobiales bacterium]|nr:MAG: hypothetical protein DLM55_02660 [Acidimicrobiales bacterium]